MGHQAPRGSAGVRDQMHLDTPLDGLGEALGEDPGRADAVAAPVDRALGAADELQHRVREREPLLVPRLVADVADIGVAGGSQRREVAPAIGRQEGGGLGSGLDEERLRLEPDDRAGPLPVAQGPENEQVLEEALLDIGHDGTGQVDVGVAPPLVVGAPEGVLRAPVHAAEHRRRAVDDEELLVVAALDRPLGVAHHPAEGVPVGPPDRGVAPRAVVGEDFGSRVRHRAQDPPAEGRVEREVVDHHLHLDAGGDLVPHQVAQASSGVVAHERERHHVQAAFGGLDQLPPLRIRLLAGGQQVDGVARPHRCPRQLVRHLPERRREEHQRDLIQGSRPLGADATVGPRRDVEPTPLRSCFDAPSRRLTRSAQKV